MGKKSCLPCLLTCLLLSLAERRGSGFQVTWECSGEGAHVGKPSPHQPGLPPTRLGSLLGRKGGFSYFPQQLRGFNGGYCHLAPGAPATHRELGSHGWGGTRALAGNRRGRPRAHPEHGWPVSSSPAGGHQGGPAVRQPAWLSGLPVVPSPSPVVTGTRAVGASPSVTPRVPPPAISPKLCAPEGSKPGCATVASSTRGATCPPSRGLGQQSPAVGPLRSPRSPCRTHHG